MNRRILDVDPETGLTVWHDYDPITKVTSIEEVYDCEPTLEHNKAIRNIGGGKGRMNEVFKKGVKGGWAYAATIPAGLIAQWKKEGLDIFDQNCTADLKKKLNSPEYAYLRTGTGRL